jgi:hypothetical protein
MKKSKDIDAEDLHTYIHFLISQKRYYLVYELFNDEKLNADKELNLKNKIKPIYYTLMYFMQDEYPAEYKRMGEELREIVEGLIEEVKELEEKYR